MTNPPSRLTTSQLLARDLATQQEFDDASLLWAFPWLALSLLVSLGVIWVVEGVRGWRRRRRG